LCWKDVYGVASFHLRESFLNVWHEWLCAPRLVVSVALQDQQLVQKLLVLKNAQRKLFDISSIWVRESGLISPTVRKNCGCVIAEPK
jgi:hypothetical protein